MVVLSWVAVLGLVAFLGLYLYWAWREEAAHPAWLRNSFYGGLVFFGALFLGFTWDTLRAIPVRTHAKNVTGDVVAGKEAWQRYVCIDCHTVLGNGAYYAPDLTLAWSRFVERAGGDEAAAQKALVTFLQRPPQATADRRGMPDHSMSREEAEHIVAFLHWVSHIDTNDWPPAPSRPVAQSAPPEPSHAGPQYEQGERALGELGCLGCHSVGGGDMVGPDLRLAGERLDRDTLAAFIADPEAVYKARGRRPLNQGFSEMPALGVDPQQADAIAAYLRHVGGKE